MTTEPRVDPLVELQTRAGNEVFNHLVGSSGRSGARSASALRGPTGLTAQPSMTVGAADDIYEREADRIAETVLRRLSDYEPGSDTSVDPSSTEPQVQRVTRLDDGVRYGGGELDADEEQAIRSAGASGRPLETDVRAEMEHGFGVDFGAVRIHADARADTLNRSLASEALTSGTDIFFRSGNYAPRVRRGTALLAHELAHTIQQGAVGGSSSPIRRSSSAGPSDVQAFFGRGTKQPKKKTYPKLEELAVRAEQGAATRPELEKALKKIDSERARTSKGKFADKEDRLETLRYLGDEIGLAIDRMRVADTKQQAKQIYLEAGKKSAKSGGLAALSAGGRTYFTGNVKGKEEGEQYGLDEAERTSISTYTADDFKYINPAAAFSMPWLKAQMTKVTVDGKAMRAEGQVGTERERLEEGGLHTGMMMSAFAKLPVWKGPGFRGERLTPEEFDAQYLTSGDGAVTAKNPTATKSAFWSVSTKREVAEAFAAALTVSVAKDKTVSVLYLIDITNARDIQKFSSLPEGEVLCPAGSTVTVTKVDKRDTGDEGKPPAIAWYEVHLKQA